MLPIYVRTGLLWEETEIHWLQRFIDTIRIPGLLDLVILEIPIQKIYGEHWSITGKNVPGFNDPDEYCFLPGRNIILLSAASVLCSSRGIDTIMHGTLRGNPFPDATEHFFKAMEETISLGLDRPFKILAPFRSLAKSDVLKRGAGLQLEYSFSCMQPRGYLHCGECNKCAERINAFSLAGIQDLTQYARDYSGERKA